MLRYLGSNFRIHVFIIFIIEYSNSSYRIKTTQVLQFMFKKLPFLLLRFYFFLFSTLIFHKICYTPTIILSSPPTPVAFPLFNLSWHSVCHLYVPSPTHGNNMQLIKYEHLSIKNVPHRLFIFQEAKILSPTQV